MKTRIKKITVGGGVSWFIPQRRALFWWAAWPVAFETISEAQKFIDIGSEDELAEYIYPEGNDSRHVVPMERVEQDAAPMPPSIRYRRDGGF